MDLLHGTLSFINRKLSWVQTSHINWPLYVQGWTWTVTLFETYLNLRQLKNYDRPAPPKILDAHFKQETYVKAQAYGKDKVKFQIAMDLLGGVIQSGLMYWGIFPKLWDLAGNIIGYFGYGAEHEILQTLAYVSAIVIVFSYIIDTPFSAYKTFVLEEKHGFNKTTPYIFVTDRIKGLFLYAAIGAPFLAGFIKIIDWAGDSFVPWVMAFVITFQMVMVVIYPTVIQPLFNKLSPLAPGELRERIEALATKLKFPLTHLYEIDGSKRSSHSNAYFFGLPWSKHIVIFDTLIKESTTDEVEAVLAHELGHWYYMHPTQMLLVSQINLFTVLAAFTPFRHSPAFIRSWGFSKSIAAKPPIIIALGMYQLVFDPFENVFQRFTNVVSRRFEWEADAFAVDLQDRFKDQSLVDLGERLGSALITLHVKNLSSPWVDWLYSAYHNSHPTLTERLKALEELSAAKKKKLT